MSFSKPIPPLKIAVVGAGISGLSAAWLLSKRHDVTLYEGDKYFGGHTRTVDVTVNGVTHPVDTGFLVFNKRTYPNLTALFACLGVGVVESEMTFSVSLAENGIEWSGSSLATLFAQKRNLVRGEFLKMVGDILRFNKETSRLAGSPAEEGLTLGEFLDRRHFSRPFRDWYLMPMAAAIWSCPTAQMLEYPLSTFVRFCRNHGLLQLTNRPQWLTVRGGARTYVDAIIRAMADVRLAAPVQHVERDAASVWVHDGRQRERYDALVLACHSDQALALLGEGASGEERAVLEKIRYQPNRAVLHHDPALLPRLRSVWSAWNYSAGHGTKDSHPVSVSYLINRLQPVPFDVPVVVSLNPHTQPRAEHTVAEFEYSHPLFDRAAIEAQRRVPSLQGRRNTWFCGAWTGYGFHEDGLQSALAVANSMGVSAPWQGDLADDRVAFGPRPSLAGAVW
ncbi:MAG: FAD-dependent oxidoreductase [Rhodocyclaceae bacterium]